jgi:GntR family transcriptional repressor for pyruvate dehydrogenase complex
VVLDYSVHAGVDILEDLVLAGDGRVNPFVVSNLLETARLLTSEVAALAADRRSEIDLQRLSAIVSEMRGEKRLSRISALDFDFHWALTSAAGNVVPRLVLNSLRGLLRSYGPLLETLYVDPDSFVEGYQHVLAALSVRDAERARSLVRWIWSWRHQLFVDILEQVGKTQAESPARQSQPEGPGPKVQGS